MLRREKRKVDDCDVINDYLGQWTLHGKNLLVAKPYSQLRKDERLSRPGWLTYSFEI